MSKKSIVEEVKAIQLGIKLISLGARMQMLESETQLSRNRLLKLYKELQGTSPPKGMLPFSEDWFMVWEHNIHSSMFYNAYQFLSKHGQCHGVEIVVNAYRLYLEHCPSPSGISLLTLTRAWTLVRFVDSGILQLATCNCCGGKFINYAYQPANDFICSLCHPPSRAVKKRKSSGKTESIIKTRR